MAIGSLNWRGWDAFAEIREDAYKRMLTMVLLVERGAKMKCPVGMYGRLRNSIGHEIMLEPGYVIRGRVGSNLKYAPYVEMGTGIHGPKKKWIRPRTAKVMVWREVTGRSKSGKRKFGWRYAKMTRGQKAQPYLRPALLAAEPNIRTVFRVWR